MNRVNPVFAATLAAFSKPVEPIKTRVVQVPVEAVHVDLPSSNPRDPETWRTAVPTDAQLIDAVQTLIARHTVELDAITVDIMTKGLA